LRVMRLASRGRLCPNCAQTKNGGRKTGEGETEGLHQFTPAERFGIAVTFSACASRYSRVAFSAWRISASLAML